MTENLRVMPQLVRADALRGIYESFTRKEMKKKKGLSWAETYYY
jgi:hypothetical protein